MQIFFFTIYTKSVESAYFVLNRTLIIVVQLINEAIMIRIFMKLKLAFEPVIFKLYVFFFKKPITFFLASIA